MFCLKGETSTTANASMSFRYYKPKEDHPDWEALRNRAHEQALAVLPKLHSDKDDSFRDWCVERWRVARSVGTSCRNYLINRFLGRCTKSHWSPPAYTSIKMAFFSVCQSG